MGAEVVGRQDEVDGEAPLLEVFEAEGAGLEGGEELGRVEELGVAVGGGEDA